jgi:hypothetical protein
MADDKLSRTVSAVISDLRARSQAEVPCSLPGYEDKMIRTKAEATIKEAGYSSIEAFLAEVEARTNYKFVYFSHLGILL